MTIAHHYFVAVWSDDAWLKEHAGATLESEITTTEGGDAAEGAEGESGVKRPAEDSDNVCIEVHAHFLGSSLRLCICQVMIEQTKT